MLPAELNRDTAPDESLISKVQGLLPRLERPGHEPGEAVAGPDS